MAEKRLGVSGFQEELEKMLKGNDMQKKEEITTDNGIKNKLLKIVSGSPQQRVFYPILLPGKKLFFCGLTVYIPTFTD